MTDWLDNLDPDERRQWDEFVEHARRDALQKIEESALVMQLDRERRLFTCPVCGRTSWHPTDVQERWCGACHGATGHPLPKGSGLRWAMLRGGSIDAGRLMQEPLPDRYEIAATGEVYVRQGDEFVTA